MLLRRRASISAKQSLRKGCPIVGGIFLRDCILKNSFNNTKHRIYPMDFYEAMICAPKKHSIGAA